MRHARAMRPIDTVLLVIGLAAGGRTTAQAALPATIAFQGQLTDQTGQPTTGSVTVVFRLYDALTGGTKLWEETQSLTVSQGLLSTLLGSVSPLTVAFDQPYWVELQVGTELLSPRQPLATSPYTFRAMQLEGLEIVSGSVGIGTASPNNKLHVAGGGWFRPGGIYPVGGGGALVDWVGLRMEHDGAVNSSTPVGLNLAISRAAPTAAIRNNLGPALVIETGNVGIGTASPTQKLEVNGAVRLAPTGAPSSPSAGAVYFDAASRHFLGFDGTSWKQLDN